MSFSSSRTIWGSMAWAEDNIAYMDKQVGALVAELDKLGLRENSPME